MNSTTSVRSARLKLKEKWLPTPDSLVRWTGSARANGVHVLHIVPFTYVDPEFRFLGSRKDIDGRQQYLEQAGVPHDTFLHLKNRRTLPEELSFFHMPDYSHIIVDLSKKEADLAYLKARWPRAKLIVRSHNPEVIHRVDYARSILGLTGSRNELLAALKNIPHYFSRELGTVRHADTILHIETMNTAWYWRALGFEGEVLETPFYVTDPYIEATPKTQRLNQVLCLSSSHPGPLIVDMVANFHKAAAALDGRLPGFEFKATGKFPEQLPSARRCARVEHLGFVEDVLELVAQSRIVAVTSDLGRGFKTKILEAISCGAWVLVTPGLMTRMPSALKPYCAVVDMSNPGDSMKLAVADLISRTWPQGDPNAALRAQAYDALDRAILSKAAPAREQSRPAASSEQPDEHDRSEAAAHRSVLDPAAS